MGLPSIALSEHQLDQLSQHIEPDKDNENKEYCSYEIFAKIYPQLAKFAQQVEKFIQTSILSESYKTLPASSYHMTIYSIYQYDDEFIPPPVTTWLEATKRTISKQRWLPYVALEVLNNEAMCILEKYLNTPLHIEYASLHFGNRTISLSLKMHEESLQMIRNARRQLTKVYGHPDSSLKPLKNKLHITLGYGYRRKITMNELNRLNYLVRPFNGAKLALPSIYLDDGDRYVPFRKKAYIDCRAYDW